jgi:uncharacterized membrane protein (UPF0127 family)
MKILELRTVDGRCVARRVQLASSFGARCLGMLRNASISEHGGMLLVPGGSIHTLGMRFSIDVVFLNKQMRVLGLAEQVPPWRFVLAPRGTARVLELAAGKIAATRLTRGTYLTVEAEPTDPSERPTNKLPRVRIGPCERMPIQFSLRLPLERRCTGPIQPPCSQGHGGYDKADQKPAALSVRTRLSRSAEAERWKRIDPLLATPSPRIRRNVALTVASSSSKSP